MFSKRLGMNGEKSIDTKLKKGHTYLVKTKFGEPEEFGVKFV